MRPFLQLIDDGAKLKNEPKHQAFGIQFAQRIFRYDNVIASSFRKVLSSKSDKVAELAKEARTEAIDDEFSEIFVSSV